MKKSMDKILNSLRKKIRYYIFPLNDIINLIGDKKFNTALDVGAGTGFMLEQLYHRGIIKSGYGVEVKPQYYEQKNINITIGPPDKIEKKYELIIFCDVLHHVRDKEDFMSNYIQKYLAPHGYVLIKDMNPKKVLYKYFNRLHDLIFSFEIIKEISTQQIEFFFKNENILNKGEKKIFLYDHYYYFIQVNN